MTVQAYINPDFGWTQKLIFLLMTMVGIIICILFIIGGVRISTASMKKDIRKQEFYDRVHNRVQRFYEMIIAGTSVMSFSCAYVIINHIHRMVESGASTDSALLLQLIGLWENGRDFILLLLICISCVLNTLLDRLIIPLKKTDKEEKACVRMLAMFYVIFILVYLTYLGDESEYSPVMIYYLGLMVGRFVYFDASFMDFLGALKNLWKNIYLLILGLTLTGILCYLGFSKGYLLERNYYIVGAFYTHLFMVLCVFILHHSHVLSLFIRKPKGYIEPEDRESEEYAYVHEFDGADYDNEEYDEDDYDDIDDEDFV